MSEGEANKRCKLGIEYMNNGEYQLAIEEFTATIELVPNNAFAYAGRAFSYSQLDEIQHAISDLTTATKLDPTDALASHALTVVKRM